MLRLLHKNSVDNTAIVRPHYYNKYIINIIIISLSDQQFFLLHICTYALIDNKFYDIKKKCFCHQIESYSSGYT